jgi:hypothetical protein
MKPLQIGLLIAASALSGAVLVKITQHRQPVMSGPTVAQAQAPAPTAAPSVTTAPVVEPLPPAPEPAVESHPSPFAVPREKPKPVRTYARNVTPAPAPSSAPAPVTQPVQPEPAPAVQQPAAEPVVPAPAPQPVPPAQPQPEHVTPPPPAPPEPQKVTLNAGTLIPVRLVDGLTTERNAPGDRFTATLDKELVVDGFVIAERGARVEGRVAASDRGGRVNGLASLSVELSRLKLSDGQWVSLSTESFERRAEETHRDDATKVGAGAAIGAVIGAIAGGGKGAAIGAGAGGAAGAGTVLATRGRAATLASETRLSFRLRNSVTITERR